MTTCSGATWGAANAGLTNTFVSALAIDPTTPRTLYAGTPGGVFKTTDAGTTWGTTGLTNTGVVALAIDPITPSTRATISAGRCLLNVATDAVQIDNMVTQSSNEPS